MGNEVVSQSLKDSQTAREPLSSVARRLDQVLQIDGILALAGWLLILLIGLSFSHQVYFSPRKLGAPAFAACLAMLGSWLCRRPFWRGIEEWWPFILMIALYQQLAPYTQVIHQGARDAQLLAIDLRLFGWAPSERLATLHNPWLTEIMTLAYASYFILPLSAAAPTFIASTEGRMRHRERFRAILTAHVIVLGIGYLGYVLVPARGTPVLPSGSGTSIWSHWLLRVRVTQLELDASGALRCISIPAHGQCRIGHRT